jgi:hypothetical protein
LRASFMNWLSVGGTLPPFNSYGYRMVELSLELEKCLSACKSKLASYKFSPCPTTAEAEEEDWGSE